MMGRSGFRSLLAGVVGAGVLLASTTVFAWGKMESEGYTAFPLTSAGDGLRYDADGNWVGIWGTGAAHTIGSSCDNPDDWGPPGSDLGCWAEPEVEGEPGTVVRHGWFHRLCTIDRTDPEITAPPNFTQEQTNRDGWSVVMNWPDLNAAADDRLVPDATDDIIPRPMVRVKALGVVNDLSPGEAMHGGRLMRHLGEVREGYAERVLTFPLGETTVHFTAIDCGGNTAVDSMVVTVEDTLPPVIEFDPAEMRIEANSPFGNIVPFPDPATHEDICDANPTATWNIEEVCPAKVFTDPDTDETVEIPAGRCTLYCEDFTICGDYLLTVTTEDLSGNSDTRQYTVHIQDTLPPQLVLAHESVEIEQEAACGTSLGAGRIPQALIGDAATPRELLLLEKFVPGNHEIPQEISDEFCFPLGETVVTYKVTDLSGNFTTKDITIEVVDTTKPNVEFIGVPPRIWHSFARTVSVEATDICDTELLVDVHMEDQPVVKEGDVYSAQYRNDNHWTVQFTVTDDDRNITVTSPVFFGIDRSPPVATYEAIPQTGVNPQNPNTYPAYFKGDKRDTLVTGTDDPGRTGHYSGWSQIQAEIDPGPGNSYMWFNRAFGPKANTDPPTGPRDINNVRCTNDEVCYDGQFDPHALHLGPHVLVIRKEDVAGNGPNHPNPDQHGDQYYYFNVFNLLLALEQADALIKDILDDPETPEAARYILEGDLATDNGDPIPINTGAGAWTGWYEKDPEGIIDWVGFNPDAKARIDGRRHRGAYQALYYWHYHQGNDDTHWSTVHHRQIGNVLLYLASITKKLRQAGEYVDTSVMLDNLTRGGIADLTGYIDFADGVVAAMDPPDDEAEADLARARSFRSAAVQRHSTDSYNQAILELMNALFHVENALFRLDRTWPNLDADAVENRALDNEDMVGALSDSMDRYHHNPDINSRETIELLDEVSSRYNRHCALIWEQEWEYLYQWCHDRQDRFLEDGENDRGGGVGIFSRRTQDFGLYLNESTWLHVLVEFADYVRMMDRAQGQHVWVRWWQWQVAHAIKYLVDFSRGMACRMHYNRDPEIPHVLCSNFPEHELLNEARCRYVTGVSHFEQRRVDQALRVYAGAECVMRKAFDEIYNTFIDAGGDGLVPDCVDKETEEIVLCAAVPPEPCVCDPETQWPYRRYMASDRPDLVYPDPPHCPPRDQLFTFVTSDVPSDDPLAETPEYFMCGDETFCPDGELPVVGFRCGDCSDIRYDDDDAVPCP